MGIINPYFFVGVFLGVLPWGLILRKKGVIAFRIGFAAQILGIIILIVNMIYWGCR